MAYAGLLDGGLRVYVGCASDWTGGTDYSSQAHGLEFETTLTGVGGGSFWIEVANPFDLSAHPNLMHGKRVNVYHTYDAVTTYLYKGFIVNDPRRGVASDTARVTVELGGPAEVGKWRTDCAFSFTDADTQAFWIENKRNNKVFNCETGDSIRISVDKGDKVPDNYRAGVIGYVPYLGAQYMMGTNAQNRFNGVKRIDGFITTKLGDNMEVRLMARTAGYTDERDVTASGWTTVHRWTGSVTNKYFDSNNWGSDPDFPYTFPTDGVKYLALAFYSKPVTGSANEMNADREVELDNVRVYTGTIARRLDEAMLEIANWMGLHNTSTTANLYSVIPTLVARPYTDPVSAMNEFSLQADCLVQWGWWPNRTTNVMQYRARKLATGEQAIKDSGSCYTVNATVPGVAWDVNTHPEDGNGDVRALRLVYNRVGRRSDWPAGTPNAVIGPGDIGFRNTGGPFQGATANVPTVHFTNKNLTDDHAKRMAKNLGRRLKNAQKESGTLSSVAPTLTRTSDSAVFPYAYVQGGEFLICTQDASVKPLVVTRCHVDVDAQSVDMDLGLPADALLRQFEAAGNSKRVWNRKRRR